MSSVSTLPMNNNYYQFIIQQAPIGYGMHKIILNKKGTPVDYLIIEVNTAYEDLIGLKSSQITGKTAKEIFKKDDHFSLKFISKYGKVAIHGGNSTFEIQNKQNDKTYRITVISEKKEYFITFISEYRKKCIQDDERTAEHSHSEYDHTFCHVLEFSPDAFIQTNGEGKITYCNEMTRHMTGYGINEIKNLSFNDIFPETDLKKIAVRSESSNQNKTLITERKLRKKDGQIIEIEIHTRILPDGYYETFIRDISDRKQYEDSLRQSEERFKRLVENSPDIVYSFSNKKGRSYHSEQVIQVLGYNPEQLKADPMLWYNSVHPDDQPMVDRVLNSAMQGNPINMEYRILCSDGKWKWLHDRSIHLYHQKDETIIDGLAMDITRRKIAEDELHLTKETYLDIFNTLTEAIYILNENGNFIEVNKGAEKMYGFSREELIGQSPYSLAEPDMNDLKNIEKILSDVFQTGRSAQIEFWGRSKTGKIFPIEVIIKKGKYFGKQVLIATARDITERKLHERSLKASEEKYRNIAENISDVVFTCDLDFNITYVSPSIERLFGEHAEAAKSRRMDEKFSEKTVERFHQVLKTELAKESDPAYDKNRTITLETELIRADGKTLHISTSLTFIRDEQGIPTGIQGTTRDITEKVTAENKLRQSEERFRDLATMLPVAVFETDAELILKFANKKAYELFGYSEDDLLKGFNCLGILSPLERDNARKQLMSKPIGKAPEIFEFEAIHKNGDLFPILLHINTITNDDALMGYRGIAIDISESKKAEALIRESEEKFKSLALLSPFAIMIYQDNRWVYTNPAGEKITGYSASDLRQMDFESLVSPDYASVVKKIHRKHLDNSNKHLDYEIQIITKQGDEKWMYFIGTQIEFHGRPAELIAAADITQRKLTEVALLNAKRKAEESDRLKSAFLANLSHEIRTPMNGILGFLEIINDINLTNKEKEYFIDVVNESSHRLLNTINDIIEMSRIESEQIDLHLTKVDLEKEMQYHYNFFKQQTEKKELQFICNSNLNQEKAIIETDKSKLDSILVNLINNAISFTEKGSIEFGNFINEGMVVFYVKDTGCGIPAHRQYAVFDRFVQADLSVTRKKNGSGLGLSIAKAYVEMLGGSIWFDSEEGLGSTFYFSIPYKPAQSKTFITKPEQNTELTIEETIKILIAEDDDTSYKYLECILQNSNIILKRALNGEEAHKIAIEDADISLILMDIRMPGMDGIEATKKIREFNHKVPIIAQTAYALESDRINAILSGCDDYISKPVNRKKLIRLIKHHLGLENRK